ncbi:MAG: trifunctional transcriptional regulator/proline dehydrogenase/L-glutamate gamma-semialdehyde dehydrogenase [Ancalomicrobiaceae bacterium]|nr:trifunctional transcriptional regulator/proline dehydrogenase/L-glutamate gamma-semialdehyde dehydrogenase [Ancalomicrobiaceae bacterium]
MSSLTAPLSDVTSAAAPAGAASAADLPPPFAAFAPPVHRPSALRDAITAAYRRTEPDCVRPLVDAATFPEAMRADIRATAAKLIEALREKPRGWGVEGLVQEYALSSQEGVALMCLAEALLRIPDAGTRDALIRDKISNGDWLSHVGRDRSLFVNAATWGLVVTGKLTASVDDSRLSMALTRLIARCGEPVIRIGVDLAMRMMGEQFVTGETIDDALSRSRPMVGKGFTYSYDMLGEAATTEADAARYYRDYERAINAIGKEAAGRGIYAGPGISIKLSALHPRYSRAQSSRVMTELLSRVKDLALIAKRHDIGLNIDAEEADRLELSLSLLEALATDPDLSGWNGLGFVVQAYGKRCPFVIDFLIDLARRAGRRLMIRLVKGAYWDAEIKRAQIDGQSDFPVFTRKAHTDVSYIASAKKLLAARDAVFPQFASHNAQTLSTVYHLAGPAFSLGDYEFQCLHGMGEPLYEEVVGKNKLDRPCRVYAPVGTHETLLAYLVRRLLENGANSSFVNRLGDKTVTVAELTTDPADTVRNFPLLGSPHEAIRLPRDLYDEARLNSAGFDLSNETDLAKLTEAFETSAARTWRAEPILATPHVAADLAPVRNPADHRDVVGAVAFAGPDDARRAVATAAADGMAWGSRPVAERAAILAQAANRLEARAPEFMALAMREAGKTASNAIAEVREAIDFLRYYAAEAVSSFGPAQMPLGPTVCISPWNFPLAIFTGQIAAALAAGNPVVAKPAEETPLIAAAAVKLLHEAGVPVAALQLLPGAGDIGATLVSAPEMAAVMFTGSTEVARLIQRQLATRLSASAKPIPLIAETGGQNAMIVDSSALAEQVVGDVIASAFDSAGQRCSALRVLCLQEETADRILAMLKGAMVELVVGRPDRLSSDVGPVITAEAKSGIDAYIERMRGRGHTVHQLELPPETAAGTFVAPTIIEIGSIGDLGREVFGPVLHIVRYAREGLDVLIDQINATGYGLTFGLHTRLDATIARVSARIRAGNLYVNRNIIGAVVGVQPFGGRGLSGTGPKAGGPLYLSRLVETAPSVLPAGASPDPAATAFAGWLEVTGHAASAGAVHAQIARSPLGFEADLAGPVGERNAYQLHPRGLVLLVPDSDEGLFAQIGAVLATGNRALVSASPGLAHRLAGLPEPVAARITFAEGNLAEAGLAAALIEGGSERILAQLAVLADLPGPVVSAQTASGDVAKGADAYWLEGLLEEVSVSINTAAAGGNASLMTIG